jgi:4,5-dihydroxyphthalate decarboxylase
MRLASRDFQDEYQVSPKDIQWRSGGEETPGRVEKIPIHLPPDVHLKPIPGDTYLSKMLDEGELDALFAARAPSCFQQGSLNVTRLFENYPEVEKKLFEDRIFPIMHIILTGGLQESWIAVSLFKAFSLAKDVLMKRFSETAVSGDPLGW